MRADLRDEAIRLARLLAELLPDEGEVLGLLALLLLHDTRRATRVDAGGDLVLLADQDRSRWDQAAIGEGHDLAAAALRPRPAAVRRCRPPSPPATPRDAADTDWRGVPALYDELAQRRRRARR